MKKIRLTIEDRILIEELLRLKYKLKDISNAVGCESSTISREIKNRRKGNEKLESCSKTKRYPFICTNCPKKVIVIRRNFITIIKKLKKIMIINLNTRELVLICQLMKLNIGIAILKIS